MQLGAAIGTIDVGPMNAMAIGPIKIVHQVWVHFIRVIMLAFPNDVEGWPVPSRAIAGTATRSEQRTGSATGQTENQGLLKEGASSDAPRAHLTKESIKY